MIDVTDILKINSMDPVSKRKMSMDAGFFFINAPYLDAYIRLLDGIREYRRLLVLTGEAGVGKSILLRKLISESPTNIKFAYCYTSNFDFYGLLTIIDDQLGMTATNKELSGKLEALKTYVNDCIARAIQVVLLIDDAHHLQKEALDGLLSLSRFEFARGRTIQVVLSGIPVLEEILSETKIFRGNVADAIHIYLKPLIATDVAAFISRKVRYDAEGPIMDSLVSPPIVERINDYTGGNPRLIDTLCEHALLITKIRGQTTLSMDIIDEAASELSLKIRQMDLSPGVDFDSLEITHSGSAAQSKMIEQLLARADLMNNEDNALRSTRMERLPAYDDLIKDTTRSLVIKPLPVSESKGFLSSIMRWKGARRFGKEYPQWLNFSGLSVALLAGLFGGMVSVYLYQRIVDDVESQASIVASVGMTTPAPMPIKESQSSPSSKLVRPVPVNSQDSPAEPEAGSSEKPLESLQTPPVVAKTTYPDEKIEVLPTSPAPSPAVMKPLDESVILSYMRNGDLLLGRGDVAAARLFYQEAASAGSVEAMVAVGKTYDPVILDQLEIKGFHPDPVKAAEWYLQAKDKAADPQSIERLEALRNWLSNSSVLGESEMSNLKRLLY